MTGAGITLLAGDAPSTLENAKTLSDLVTNVITSAALIVGGIWAYFRFVKERTYRPRLDVSLSGQWIQVSDRRALLVRIAVKNIGASVVTLLQRGTGVKVQTVSDAPGSGLVGWDGDRVFEVLVPHQWIEPGETVTDELLVDPGTATPGVTRILARLVWKWAGGDENIVVTAARIVPLDAGHAVPDETT